MTIEQGAEQRLYDLRRKYNHQLNFYRILGKPLQVDLLENDLILVENAIAEQEKKFRETPRYTFTNNPTSDIMVSKDEKKTRSSNTPHQLTASIKTAQTAQTAQTKTKKKKGGKLIMAKKAATPKAPKAEVTTVFLKDLAEEYGVEPRTLRAFIRSLGIRAPEIKQEGFGPRAKYEWASDSEELAKIKAAMENQLEDEDETEDAEVAEDEDEEEEVEAPPVKKSKKRK